MSTHARVTIVKPQDSRLAVAIKSLIEKVMGLAVLEKRLAPLKGLAPRDFHFRQPNGQFAARHKCPDLGKSTARAVAAMAQAIAIAGLSTPLSLKPQNRPDFHIHSNHQIRPPPSPRGASLRHGRIIGGGCARAKMCA